jgi:succinoglycan biosynthesis protein ExoM
MRANTDSKTTITVGICTCGRPELASTLKSLAAQKLPDYVELTLLVADNASPPAADQIIEQFKMESGIRIAHLIAPPYNISRARNKILENTTTRWLAFIDDDETAHDHWIDELLKRAELTHAAAVFGPVKAEYPPNTPAWMVKGDFHSTDVTFVNGKIVTGYSCNVLMDLGSPYFRNLSFAPELGSTGGEDTIFFSQVSNSGGQLDYAPNALLSEPVTPARAKLSWLFKRRFRSGQTHAAILLTKGRGARARAIVPTLSKILFCMSCMALTAPSQVSSIRWLLRAGLHLGVISRLLGVQDLKLYAQPN